MTFLFQAAPDAGSPLPTIAMFGLILLVMYFLMIRPQQKRQKEHKNMLETLQPGDKILTSSGMVGVIKGMDEQTFTIEIASNTHVKFQKSAVTGKADVLEQPVKK